MKTTKPLEHRSWAGALIVLAAFTACASSPDVAPQAGALPPNAPDWVLRGSRVVDGSIFGLGSVSGIANVPLARDTANQRARAEIARILEVYSASLMKDYQSSVSAGDLDASDEGQNVESAIKTFSSSLLKGAEPRELWLDSDSNTWFALVELDFERARTIAENRPARDGGLAGWVEANGSRVLSELEEETFPARPAAAWTASSGAAAVGSGERPVWVDGRCARTEHLCGVGQGTSPSAADTQARAALALVFEANIRTVAESFQSAAREATARTGDDWRDVERVSEHSMVRSDKVVAMSEIVERWEDEANTVWSLAVIKRGQAATALSDRIVALDRAVAAEMERARAAPSELARISTLRRALRTLAEREALDADLRVVRADGTGIPSQVLPQDIVALLAASSSQLSFGLAFAGPGAARVRECVEAALGQAGHAIDHVEVDESASTPPSLPYATDVRIDAWVRADAMGRMVSGEVVETTLTLRLVNGSTGQTVRTVSGSAKATRPTVSRAAATAAFKVCQKQVPSMIRDIDRYFQGETRAP